jgi:glycosyltransferase involved in cell wall biosynthesis
MRIVLLVANLEIGGLERQVLDLAHQQRLSGHDPRIYCLFHAGPLGEEAARLGIPVTTFDKPLGLSLGTLSRIVRRLRADKPEALHTHNAVVHHYGAVAAKLAGIPVVVNTQHGTGTLADMRLSRIFRAVLPWTSLVVSVGEGVRQFLVKERRIPVEKTRVILNGIPLAKFEQFVAHPASRLPAIRFGTVGRLERPKDHRTLLNAFAQVAADLPDAELHIAGGGSLRDDLDEQLRALNLTGRVRMHGARNDVPAFLSTLDIFVLSSVTEGLPIAVLEAMAVGLPIVSTRVNGIGEVTSPEFAEYCNPGQPAELAEAMLRMAHKPDLGTVGDAARELARNHGVAQTWWQYERLFQDLITGMSSPSVRPISRVSSV